MHSRNTNEMLIVLLILVTTTFTTNGFPSSPQTETSYTEFENLEQQSDVFQNSGQQQLIFQTPGEQQALFQTPEEEEEAVYQIPERQEAIYQVPEQQVVYQAPEPKEDLFPTKVNQNEPIDDYFASGGTQLAEHGAAFTFRCTGANRICTSKNDCINGYIHSTKSASYSSSSQVEQCRIQDQVCCTITNDFPTGAETSSTNYQQNAEAKESTGQSSLGVPTQFDTSQSSAVLAPTHLQLGCAAALLCVEEKFCTLDGTINPEPVILSEKQLLRRVPLNSCKDPTTGLVGKCCRDPNYVDPWPTGNLPANYSGGFDEQGFPTFLNIAKVKPSNSKKPTPPAKTAVKHYPTQQHPVKTKQKSEPTLVPENSDIFTKTLIPPKAEEDTKSDYNTAEQKLRCGIRNKVTQQSESEESNTVFAEIPWQTMVLLSKERKILCSGALISAQDVLTAANCIDGLSPSDVSIKLGEWKLGYELPHEEPLPFQIVNVSSIKIHPGYARGHGAYDIAVLHLESPVVFDLHINPLCLQNSNRLVESSQRCITTGWGKSILQAHYAGVIMHAVNMDVLSTESCKERLVNTNNEVDIADGTICAAPQKERNNVCEADVGGPLACQNEYGFYDLVGIYSQDTGCLPTDQVAIFAPLDQTWLKEAMLKSTSEEISISYDEELLSDNYRKSTLTTDNQYLPPV